MELTRNLRVSIADNRSDWLRSWGCMVICFEEISICLNEHYPKYNSLFDLQYPDRESATPQIRHWVEKIRQETGYSATIWVDNHSGPGYLDLLLPDLGLRLVSTSYTLVAKTEDVERTKLANIPIWQVKTGARERKAWIDVYCRAFRSADHAYEYARWVEAFNKLQDVETHFYLGFRHSGGLGDLFPGQPSAVGQVVIGHGVGGVYNIGTVPEYRGRGFASGIVSFLGTVGRQAGLQHLYLVTQTPKFFEKLGFTVAFQNTIWQQT